MKIINFLAKDLIELNGILYNENTNTKSVILAVHGMGSNCFKNRDNVISAIANKNNLDYFCFNNRGSELARFVKQHKDGKITKILAGTSFENPLEGYEDIVGAIETLKKFGYENIYLQGHSLGSTKILYTYNRLKKENSEILENIKGLILLSLIDLVSVLNTYLGENYQNFISMAEDFVNNKKENEIMPREAFIQPISAKCFLIYTKNSQEINIIHYGKDDKMEYLNNVEVPLFMRWGNVNELIEQPANELCEIVRGTVKNEKLDINFIDGADHSYTDKEEELAKKIVEFVSKGTVKRACQRDLSKGVSQRELSKGSGTSDTFVKGVRNL